MLLPLARPRRWPQRQLLRAAAVLVILLLLPMASSSGSAELPAKDNESETAAVSTSAQPQPPLPSPPPSRSRRHHRPVLLLHGMGDSCCAPRSMGALAAAIRREIPGTTVLSVDTSFKGRRGGGGGGGGAEEEGASSASEDVLSGFFGDVSSQVERACGWLRSHPAIRDSEEGGFDAVGFSQGGLFLRALVQRCAGGGGGGGRGGGGGGGGGRSSSSSPPPPPPPSSSSSSSGFSSSSSTTSSSFAPRARTLITLGSPHQGVTAFPSCDVPVVVEGREEEREEEREGRTEGEDFSFNNTSNTNVSSSLFCRAAEALIQRGAFSPGIRDRVVQAQYFKVGVFFF